jgi:hypothetical protein
MQGSLRNEAHFGNHCSRPFLGEVASWRKLDNIICGGKKKVTHKHLEFYKSAGKEKNAGLM